MFCFYRLKCRLLILNKSVLFSFICLIAWPFVNLSVFHVSLFVNCFAPMDGKLLFFHDFVFDFSKAGEDPFRPLSWGYFYYNDFCIWWPLSTRSGSGYVESAYCIPIIRIICGFFYVWDLDLDFTSQDPDTEWINCSLCHVFSISHLVHRLCICLLCNIGVFCIYFTLRYPFMDFFSDLMNSYTTTIGGDSGPWCAGKNFFIPQWSRKAGVLIWIITQYGQIVNMTSLHCSRERNIKKDIHRQRNKYKEKRS